MQIGTLTLDRALALAPMEDVTDVPFRLICKELGADLVYTEFANSEGLIRDVKKSLKKIQVAEEERPVAVQIYGHDVESMARAAEVAEEAGPDFIDINCGCWVKKVVLREAGAGLLRNPAKFEQIVRSVMGGTSLPVTVKTRLGWDEDSIIILDIARMLEQLGVQALTVHCRTRQQGHKGDADWSWLEKLKNAVEMPIIGNGDVIGAEDVQRMLDTGCDGVMIGRGAIQHPWIFKEAKHYLATGELLPPPTLRERVDLCLKHLRLTVQYKGEYGSVPFRKHYSGYLKGLPRAARLRSELMQYKELAPIEEVLNRYVLDAGERAVV